MVPTLLHAVDLNMPLTLQASYILGFIHASLLVPKVHFPPSIIIAYNMVTRRYFQQTTIISQIVSNINF